MAGFPTVFANANTATGAQLDACLNFAAVLGAIPCTAAGTNTLVLSLTANAGPVAAYQQNMLFGFVVPNTNTGATTANPNGLGALPVYVDSTIGPVAMTGGELEQGNFALISYDAALAGFHLVNSIASGGGGGAVSSVNGQAGAVTTGAAGFMHTAVDVYIQPTGGHSCFIRPSAAGQIDDMSLGRTSAFDVSAAGQLKSISPIGSPTGGSLGTTFTSLNATAATIQNVNREFIASVGATINTGQGVANGNGAKVGLYVGTQCVPGTGGHNPGDTRAVQIVMEADASTGTYSVQGIELDLISSNATTTFTGISTSIKSSGTPVFAAWMSLTAFDASSTGKCNQGIAFGSGTTSPIAPTGAAIYDPGTSGSTVLQIEGTHTKGIYFNNATCTNAILLAGVYGDAISFAAGTYTRGIGLIAGSYTYCIDTHLSTVSAAAIRIGNNQALSARNAANTLDVLLMQLTPSNVINIGDTNSQNIFVSTPNSGVFGPIVDNNTQCGFAGSGWGSVWSHSYQTLSDPSLKTAIEALPSATALLKTVDPIAYAHRDDATGARKWGFDAKNVHEAFGAAGFAAGHRVERPIDADGEPAGEPLHAYDTNALVAALWRQNQELLARIEVLEAKGG